MSANQKTDKYNDPFPTRLRNLMETRNVTQQMLADAIGVKRQTISAYSDGSADPTLPRLSAMADYFHVSVDNLIGKHKSTTPDNEEIRKRIGLTDGAISTLEMYYHWSEYSANGAIPSLISAILETEEGRKLIEQINLYVFADFSKIYDAAHGFAGGVISSFLIDSGKATIFMNAGFRVKGEELVGALLVDIPQMIKDLRAVVQKGEYGASSEQIILGDI